MKRYLSRIGPKLRETGRVEVVRSPFDAEPVGEVCVGDARDMDDAIAAAVTAFETTRRLPAHHRASILDGVSSRLAARSGEVANLMAQESGKPIRYCRGEVDRAVLTFTLGAAGARTLGGEVMPVDLEARAEGRLCLFTRVPRGPVAAISPSTIRSTSSRTS